MTEIINAFHINYVRTHMPELLSSVRVENNQIESGKVNGSKSARAVRETVGGQSSGPINNFPKTKRRGE